MTYLERQERNGKTYYYIVKNLRVGAKQWKKIRKYVGEKPPSKEKIRQFAEEIEKEAREKGLLKQLGKYSFLTDEEAEQLQDLKNVFKSWYGKLDVVSKKKYEDDFLVRFTYNSNAIEGNRLSLRETSMILTEGIIPAGVLPNDYNEAINSRDCFEFIKKYSGELNQKFLLEIHKILTKNTKCKLVGTYRNHDVRISGSDWVPPSHMKIAEEMKKFFQWYYHARKALHVLELAAIAHNRLVRIHPFSDGNGRTSRMVLNWLLNKKGFPTLFIELKDKVNYYKAIEEGDKGDDHVFVHYLANVLMAQHTFKSENAS